MLFSEDFWMTLDHLKQYWSNIFGHVDDMIHVMMMMMFDDDDDEDDDGDDDV